MAVDAACRPGQVPTLSDSVHTVSPQWEQDAGFKSSGNANFDAYRKELLNRLELEQENFDGFLARLREAKDKAEFDQFMEDRAKAAREAARHDNTPIEL